MPFVIVVGVGVVRVGDGVVVFVAVCGGVVDGGHAVFGVCAGDVVVVVVVVVDVVVVVVDVVVVLADVALVHWCCQLTVLVCCLLLLSSVVTAVLVATKLTAAASSAALLTVAHQFTRKARKIPKKK